MAGCGNDVLIVEIGHHRNNPPRLIADADKLHHPVRPPHRAVHRVLPWERALRQTLADNHHALRTVLVAVVEVTPLQNRHAKRRKKIPATRDRNFARKSCPSALRAPAPQTKN
jgi:hypothetical protein